jgi:hypothetical protein
VRYRNQIARAALGVAIVIGTATTIKSQDPDVATRRAYGDHDFIPAPISEHIADGIPGAWLRVLKFCEHFAYLECAGDGPPGAERFFRSSAAAVRPR